jgi:hypothetical protein
MARTQHEYARLLLARDAPGDQERARDLHGVALETARALGMRTLAARIENTRVRAPTAATLAEAVFRREGEYWSIVYERDAFRLRHSKGLQYLARLMAAPGEELHALELAGADTVGVRVRTGAVGNSPPLGAHLERTVRTGTFCRYSPDPRLPISWRL